jgi:hypothetical protein
VEKRELWEKCQKLIAAYKNGELGDCSMPEDANPGFKGEARERRLSYFTLPMSLNYQRDSYSLWKAALKTYGDKETREVFEVEKAANMEIEKLRQKLVRYRLALQPNNHIKIWRKIAETVYYNWDDWSNFWKKADNDLEIIRGWVQVKFKTGFPYLSGPKIFNYWSFIMSTYGQVEMKNKEIIEIAPDTHVTKGSVRMGVITPEEVAKLSKEEISRRWREVLAGSGIAPIEMHPPMWFWSRGGFRVKL